MTTDIERVHSAPMTHEGDIGHMVRLAEQLSQARGMLPDHLRTPGAIVAVLLTGRELGLAPMASIRGLYLVHGKVGASYDTMIGLLRRAGYRIEWIESTGERATLRLTHPDGSTHEETWDKARAKTAGLWGGRGPWSNYPETMLRARCVSSAGRAFAGDVLAGVYTTEEAHEIARAKGIEPPGSSLPDIPSKATMGVGPAPRGELTAGSPLVATIAAMAEPVEAGEMSAEDARARVYAMAEALDDLDDGGRRAAGAAIARVLRAAGCPDDRIKDNVSRWVHEAPADNIEEAEIVGEETAA